QAGAVRLQQAELDRHEAGVVVAEPLLAVVARLELLARVVVERAVEVLADVFLGAEVEVERADAHADAARQLAHGRLPVSLFAPEGQRRLQDLLRGLLLGSLHGTLLARLRADPRSACPEESR